MTESENLDKLIEEYSKKLMSSIPKEQIVKSSVNTKAETESQKEQKSLPMTENDEENTDTENTEADIVESENVPEEEPESFTPSAQESMPEEQLKTMQMNTTEPEPIPTDPENFSTFLARVFTGGGAFGVPGAKVVLYRGDVLHSFLTTDESGETKRIKLESYPEENSLEPLSDEQRLNYSADVFADGFTEKRGLLVSAVGGADIILTVELTPESEGIN